MDNGSDQTLESELDDELDKGEWNDLLGGALGPGDVLADKYRLEELLGLGAMGFVLRAWHLQLDEPVAVKFLLPEFAANPEALVRFEREARAAFKIKSQHVARVVDVGRLEQGLPFMVMEFLDGGDLGELMYGKQLPIAEAVEYLLQTCDAVAEAHALGIVHRDLKPDNLFVTTRRDGSACIKVLDFGLSKVVSPTDNAPRERAITGEAQVMGTACYMSPEQWMAAKDVGKSTDIWALGIILYEALGGETPFLRETLAEMCSAVLQEAHPPLEEMRPDAPAELTAVVNKCLMKSPEDRYESVEQLIADLMPWSSDADLPPHSSAGGPPSSGGPISLEAPPSSRRAELLAPVNLPRLGLVSETGGIDSWEDIMAAAPPPASSRTRLAITVVVAVVASILLAAVVLL